MITVNGIMAYDCETAYDLLNSFGLDRMEIEELANLLTDGESRIEAAEHTAKVARQEFEAIEAYNDHVRSVLNEVINITDEALNMERISKARERFESISNLINNEL